MFNFLKNQNETNSKSTTYFYFNSFRFIAEEVRPDQDEGKFKLNGKWVDYTELPFVPESSGDAETGVWMRDRRNGRTVLYFAESIPTFDSGDRMYDSVAKWYFMWDNENISVLNIHHGYQLGSVTLYENIRGDNDDTEAFLAKIREEMR